MWFHMIFRGTRNTKCGTLQTLGWGTEEQKSNSHHLSAALVLDEKPLQLLQLPLHDTG